MLHGQHPIRPRVPANIAPGLIGLLATLSLPAGARTLSVGPGQTYSHPQAAINAARHGDQIVIQPGVYTLYPGTSAPTLDFLGKKIVVRSTDPSNPSVVAATVLELASSGPWETCLSIVSFNKGEGRDSVLRGLTIRNGRDPYYGSGVRMTNGSSPTIEACVFENNHCQGGPYNGGPGGAIYAGDGAPLIRRCTFQNNSANTNIDVGRYGGAIFAGGHAVIRENLFTGNNDAVSCAGDAEVLNNRFQGNGSYDGAVYLYGSALVQGNTFESNEGTLAGGLIVRGGSPNIVGNRFRANRAASGAAVAVYGGSPYIGNNLITNNVCTGIWRLGAVHVEGPATARVEGNTIVGNQCTNTGGEGAGIFASSGATIRNCIIAFNGPGGGIFAYPDAPVVRFCDVYNNEGGDYRNMADRTGLNGNIRANPLFASGATGDYHLKSQYGRSDPATKTWVKDTVTSPCINAGDPGSPYSKEPAPNGGRVNMGRYANTAQASKSDHQPPLLYWPGGSGYTSDGVQPDQAPPGSNFTFKVRYRHYGNKAPSWVRLYLWKPNGSPVGGSPFTMTAAGSSWSAGVVFAKSLSLDAHGQYCYAIETRADTWTVRLPPSETGKIPGPVVNRLPVLTWDGRAGYVSDGLEPHSQVLYEDVVFRVKYADPDGDPPASVDTLFWEPSDPDGDPWEAGMYKEGTSTDYQHGVPYYRKVFCTEVGVHHYAFQAQDQWGATARLPATGKMNGPTVTGSSGASLALTSVVAQQMGNAAVVTYTLGGEAEVQATVLNLAGRIIAEIPAGRQEAGVRNLRWNGRNQAGNLVPAGLYLVCVSARAPDGASAQAICPLVLRR